MAKRKLYYYWEWPFPQGTLLWLFGIDIIADAAGMGERTRTSRFLILNQMPMPFGYTHKYMGAQTRISTENHSLTMSF